MAAYRSVLLTLRAMRDSMHLTRMQDGAKRNAHAPLAFAAAARSSWNSLGLDGSVAVPNGQLSLSGQKAHSARAEAARGRVRRSRLVRPQRAETIWKLASVVDFRRFAGGLYGWIH